MLRALWLCSALLLGGCAARLQAGSAAVDLTPDWPVALGGYGARMGALSKGVHDPVMAKALYLEGGGRKVVLVTTDLIGSLRDMRDDVRAQLPPDVDVIFAASHTHSAPSALVDTKNFILTATIGRYDPRLRAWMRDRFVDVIRRAIAARGPATFAIGSADAPEFCRNRRSEHYPKGDAPVDPALGVMRVGGAIVVNYTAHPTIVGPKSMDVSADWPGALQRHLEKLGAVALFTNGAEGDMSPAAPGGEDDFEKCERLGAALAERALAVRLTPPRSDVAVRYVEREIELPKPSMPWATKSVIGVLEIGDAALVCVPGELTVDLGLELKRRFREMGWRHAWIVGLANDHLFYILSEEQYRKGGYERTMSFYGPGFGPWLVEQIVELGRSRRP